MHLFEHLGQSADSLAATDVIGSLRNTFRASLPSALTGGLFISADGTQRIVLVHGLNQTELLYGSRLLRLSYSFCTIEVSGRELDSIFEDASIGRLGTIQVAPVGAVPGDEPWVTSIAAIVPPQSPFSAHEEEC
jgi:hypothetical protein